MLHLDVGCWLDQFYSTHFGLKQALKVIDKEKLRDKKALKLFENELRIHQMLNHKNIIRLLTTFEDNFNHYLVMEHCDQGELGKLVKNHYEVSGTTPGLRNEGPSPNPAGSTSPSSSKLSSNGKLSIDTIRNYAIQLTQGIQYLHLQGFIHRDIKLENILVSNEGKQLKICDFGFAIHFRAASEKKNLQTICGTLNYLAPEVFKAKEYSRKVDIWSLGCVLFALATGSLPFQVKQTIQCPMRRMALFKGTGKRFERDDPPNQKKGTGFESNW